MAAHSPNIHKRLVLEYQYESKKMKTQKNLCDLLEPSNFHSNLCSAHHSITSPWLSSRSYFNKDQTRNAYHTGCDYAGYRPRAWTSGTIRPIIFWSPSVWVQILVLHLLVDLRQVTLWFCVSVASSAKWGQ